MKNCSTCKDCAVLRETDLLPGYWRWQLFKPKPWMTKDRKWLVCPGCGAEFELKKGVLYRLPSSRLASSPTEKDTHENQHE